MSTKPRPNKPRPTKRKVTGTGTVKITVIDDRFREILVPKCPFIGPIDVYTGKKDEVPYGPYTRCNVDATAQPICVGLDHEYCLLRQYNSFRVEIPDAPKVDEVWRSKKNDD